MEWFVIGCLLVCLAALAVRVERLEDKFYTSHEGRVNREDRIEKTLTTLSSVLRQRIHKLDRKYHKQAFNTLETVREAIVEHEENCHRNVQV